MEVRASNICGGGQGLFAITQIPRGTVIRFCKFSPQPTSSCRRRELGPCDVLDFYVRRGTDRRSRCLVEGRVKTLKDVVIDRASFKRMYVCAQRMLPIMKANDLAWTSGIDERIYEQRARRRNCIELILEFGPESEKDGRRRVIDVCAHVTRTAKAGQELGMSYGYNYWV